MPASSNVSAVTAPIEESILRAVRASGVSEQVILKWLLLMERVQYGKVVANKSGDKPIRFTIEENFNTE